MTNKENSVQCKSKIELVCDKSLDPGALWLLGQMGLPVVYDVVWNPNKETVQPNGCALDPTHGPGMMQDWQYDRSDPTQHGMSCQIKHGVGRNLIPWVKRGSLDPTINTNPGSATTILGQTIPEQLPDPLQDIVTAAKGVKQIRHVLKKLHAYLGNNAYLFFPNHDAQEIKMFIHNKKGDCKDYTLATCILLKALGYDVCPALQIGEKSINHWIVRAQKQGQIYWLDPTNSTDINPGTVQGHRVTMHPNQDDSAYIPIQHTTVSVLERRCDVNWDPAQQKIYCTGSWAYAYDEETQQKEKTRDDDSWNPIDHIKADQVNASNAWLQMKCPGIAVNRKDASYAIFNQPISHQLKRTIVTNTWIDKPIQKVHVDNDLVCMYSTASQQGNDVVIDQHIQVKKRVMPKESVHYQEFEKANNDLFSLYIYKPEKPIKKMRSRSQGDGVTCPSSFVHRKGPDIPLDSE